MNKLVDNSGHRFLREHLVSGTLGMPIIGQASAIKIHGDLKGESNIQRGGDAILGFANVDIVKDQPAVAFPLEVSHRKPSFQ